MTTQWRYFLAGDPGDAPELADRGEAGIVRLPVDAPVSLAEAVLPPGEWSPTEIMWREKYLGSGDWEFTEISGERAQELLRRWVQIGRLERMPDEASMITPELAEHLTAMDKEAEARWRNVPKPPGAEDISS